MRRLRWILTGLITATLLLAPILEAAPSSSGGSSRGYSSGSSRSSSSSGSSRGYSSGSSRSSSPSSSRSSSPSSNSSRGYSSGSSSKPSYSPSRSSSPSSSNSSRGYSSSPSSSPKPPASTSRGYSSSPSKPSESPVTRSTPSSSSGESWLSGWSDSGKKEQSKRVYESSNPKPKSQAKPGYTYRTRDGWKKEMNPKERDAATHVQKVVTPHSRNTYRTRSQTVYRDYQPQPYQDHFSPFLMGYLFSSAMNSNERANWAYHHRDEMSPVRYQEMLAKDAELEAKIKQLEAAKTPVQSGYVPTGLDPDLMYTEDFVTGALTPPTPISEPVSSESSGLLWVILLALPTLFILAFIVWIIFFKEFKTTRSGTWW